MNTRYETERGPMRGGERPRDEQGRFESEADRRHMRGSDRPRDEYGRFEPESERRSRQQGAYGSDDYDGRDNSSWQGYASSGRRYDMGRFQRPEERYDGASYSQNQGYRGSNSYGQTESMFNMPSNYGRDTGTRYQGNDGMTQNRYPNLGQHSGHGPKGYRRSDERIQEDVNEALSQDPDLDAGEIEVKVSNGEVTLTGTVEERRFKRMAEEIVERCSGVRDVRNEIRIHQEDETGREGQNHQSKGKAGR